MVVDSRNEIRDFLTSRRAKITPEQAGLQLYGGNGSAVFAPIFASAARPANIARFLFPDPPAPEFYADWDRLAGDTVALLRADAYETMELTADQGLRLNAYSAEPGSPSEDALTLLASWTAPQRSAVHDADRP